MTAPEPIDVAHQRRRLSLMLGINLVCLAIAVAAAVGVFAYHVMSLIYVFVAALLAGFAAHVWLMLGLARRAGPKGSA
jgi:membrane protein YdbS with pleckstrin-like domain